MLIFCFKVYRHQHLPVTIGIGSTVLAVLLTDVVGISHSAAVFTLSTEIYRNPFNPIYDRFYSMFFIYNYQLNMLLFLQFMEC